MNAASASARELIFVYGGPSWRAGGGNEATARRINRELQERQRTSFLFSPEKTVHNEPPPPPPSLDALLKTTEDAVKNPAKFDREYRQKPDKIERDQREIALLRDALVEHPPALLVSVPPSRVCDVREAIRQAAEREPAINQHLPVVTPLSDIGGGIISPQVDRANMVTAPSETMKQHLIRDHKMPAENVFLSGLMLPKENVAALRRDSQAVYDEIRNELQLPKERPDHLLVISGGSNGLGPIEKAFAAANSDMVHEAADSLHIVTVAGKNEELRNALNEAREKLPEKARDRNTILPFTDKFSKLLLCSTISVQKAGGGASMDIIARGQQAGKQPFTALLFPGEAINPLEHFNTRALVSNGFAQECGDNDMEQHILRALSGRNSFGQGKTHNRMSLDGIQRVADLIEDCLNNPGKVPRMIQRLPDVPSDG